MTVSALMPMIWEALVDGLSGAVYSTYTAALQLLLRRNKRRHGGQAEGGGSEGEGEGEGEIRGSAIRIISGSVFWWPEAAGGCIYRD